jgi:hypothetical protein
MQFRLDLRMIAVNDEECRTNGVVIINNRFFIIQVPSRFANDLEFTQGQMDSKKTSALTE